MEAKPKLKKRWLESMEESELLKTVENIARRNHDGHFTILAFTTNFRVGFGTPYSRDDYEGVWAFPTLKEALINAVVNEPEF